jgi:hypothetical protein
MSSMVTDPSWSSPPCCSLSAATKISPSMSAPAVPVSGSTASSSGWDTRSRISSVACSSSA